MLKIVIKILYRLFFAMLVCGLIDNTYHFNMWKTIWIALPFSLLLSYTIQNDKYLNNIKTKESFRASERHES